MLFAVPVILALASSVFASPPAANSTRLVRTCGTVISDEDLIAAEARFAALRVKPVPSLDSEPLEATLNIFYHVVSEDETLDGGNVPDDQLEAQTAVMNAAYAGSGITWVTAGVTRTVNATWFNSVSDVSPLQTDMKVALRTGGAADLNVYTVGFKSGDAAGLLGYATFPFSYADDPNDDGVVMLFSSLPGGTAVPYNLGQTLTHESGHWVGLFHTFQGGCSASGDMVSDTPPERSPNFGCPTTRDSCSGDGVDPIHNYMDYSDDVCMTEFTAGQIERLKAQMSTFRQVAL
ncbi:Metalloprotease [Mycena rebaudengoi]|nr:Metalloprotease [Mycena rebaudengoi]